MADGLSVGVLGAGNIGAVHVQSASVIDGVSAVSVADREAGRRARGDALGADRTYADYGDLLANETPDVAVVALPPSLHADAAVAAVEHGCDVFVEKPFARTVAEATDIVDAAADAGRRVGVDHTLRYQDDVRAVRDAYESGRLGHVPLATVRRINDGPFSPPPVEEPLAAWQLDPGATGGGALMDLGVHLFDVLEWLFGDLEVTAATTDAQLDLPYEDAATVHLRSRATGTTATLQCGYFQWEHPPDVNSAVRLDGVAGSMDSRDVRPSNFVSHAAKSAAANAARAVLRRDPSYFAPTYYYRAHYRALADFVDAVRAGREPPVDGESGLRTIELAAAAYEHAREGDVDRDVELTEGSK